LRGAADSVLESAPPIKDARGGSDATDVERRGARRIPVELPVLLLALLAAGGSVWASNRALERQVVATGDPTRVGPLPDGKALRVMSLGFERLVADLFWLRTVYYIGDPEVHRAGFPDIERLAELVTDIDPHFRSAYVILASVLTVLKKPTEFALAFLDKGIEHNDDYWKLHFLKGFTLFYDFGRNAEAARHIEAAWRHGGPPYLQLLAARLYAEGGSAETAIAFVQARLRETDDPGARRQLERRLRSLSIMRDLAAIDSAITAYRAHHGAAPASVADLVRAGLLPALPRDPRGEPYDIVEGRAHSRTPFERLELHRAGGAS
jgi:tetratricopeptide (TPR) repeat protein